MGMGEISVPTTKHHHGKKIVSVVPNKCQRERRGREIIHS